MKLLNNVLLFLIICSIGSFALAQSTSSSDILESLHRLKSPYRVLYLAAHPDDENTKLISYFTGHEKAEVAYLSLTRGSGGQNLIGSEKGVLLGVLRTEELLAARRIDGARQFFTHALDFGYSKTSEESFRLWEKEIITEDVVYVMRYFKPHVIINRFPPTNYAGHGHHQASAILSAEAFDLCGDSSYFPGNLRKMGIWSPGSLYFNASSWWDKTLPERAKNDQLITEINIGQYNSVLGYSYNELAALSRSQHKTQGFGSSPSRGDQFEYLEYVKGMYEPGKILNPNLLDSIDRQWLDMTPKLDEIIAHFDAESPVSSLSALLALRDEVAKLTFYSNRFSYKLENLDAIIGSCLGLSIELKADRPDFTHRDTIVVHAELLNRSDSNVSLISMVYQGDNEFTWNRPLLNNELFKDTFLLEAWKHARFSNPYWVDEPWDNRYHYDSDYLKTSGSDMNCPVAMVNLNISGRVISYFIPIQYFWTDRVKGGLKKNIRILPEISLAFDRKIYFPGNGKITGNVVVSSHSNNPVNGELVLIGDSSLKCTAFSPIHLETSGASVNVPFELTYADLMLEDKGLRALFVNDSDTFGLEFQEIEYDHIRPQIVLTPCSAQVVPIEFNRLPGRIAYISGPDNEIVNYLKDIGCAIEEITESDILSGELEYYNVLLFGIRSINVNPALKKYVDQIHTFTQNGGTVVVMYQTSQGINPLEIAPYPFEISRNRVTDEAADVRIVDELHPIVNKPYKLNGDDFKGWNQERGLYFAGERSEKYQVLFGWSDHGAEEDLGSLIVGDYGKGAFIYTGISFFRHIPAGVPGSYKLLLNILSYKPEQ